MGHWARCQILFAATALAVVASDPAAPARGVPVPAPAFVGSEGCRGCHEYRHQTWLDTAHAYSLREATPEHVEGRFDGRTVEATGFSVVPYRLPDGFYMRIHPLDGRPAGNHKVDRVVGRTFEQAYLFLGPRGEWRVLPLSWSIEREAWDLTHEVLRDLAGGAELPPDYDSRTNVFSHGCGQCHATDYDVGYRELPGGDHAYDSRLLEGAVACESCHGPGSVHVTWHQQAEGPKAAYVAPARLLQPLADLNARQVLGSCGRCHYVHDWRYAIDADPKVPYPDIAVSANYDKPGFFADGRLNGLNYHGSTQSWSRCFLEGGMSCLDCHQMHGGKKWALRFAENDDAQCAKCHGDLVRDPEPHTRHADVRCVDCHMPKLMSGVLHFMRDHSLSSPEPELTELFGDDQSPNACAGCHREPVSWLKEKREQLWGPTPRRLVEDVGAVVALRKWRGWLATGPGKTADPVPTDLLAKIAERQESRLFHRLTALRGLRGRKQEAARVVIRRLLADPDPEVRVLAAEAIGRDPHPTATFALLPLLRDPVRTVRVEAAHALVRCGYRDHTPELARAYTDAGEMLVRQRPFNEWLDRIAFLADVVDGDEAFQLAFRRYMSTLPPRPTPESREIAADLTGRAGRRLAEQGSHQQALTLYERVHELRNGRTPLLLWHDAAASFAASGQGELALSNWETLRRRSPPGSLSALIAEIRLHSARDSADAAARAVTALRGEMARAEQDPAAGEWLRRARHTLEILGR